MVDRKTFKERLQAAEVVRGPFTIVPEPMMAAIRKVRKTKRI